MNDIVIKDKLQQLESRYLHSEVPLIIMYYQNEEQPRQQKIATVPEKLQFNRRNWARSESSWG